MGDWYIYEMKLSFISFFICLSLVTRAQFEICIEDFDDSDYCDRFLIDTVSNPNNVWQIGIPQKNIFAEAHSQKRAIVTDTLNSYPSNDTSSFTFVHLADNGFTYPHTVVIGGFYKVNSDTLTDYGKIEFSPDKGITWIELFHDSINLDCPSYALPKPVFSGNSNGWKSFTEGFECFGEVYNIEQGDTLYYRFTFISDSVQTNKEGLMFDDLVFQDYAEGIPEIGNKDIIQLSPNPASIQLNVSIKNLPFTKGEIILLSLDGRIIQKEKFNYQTTSAIDVGDIPCGVYEAILKNEKYMACEKFTIIR